MRVSSTGVTRNSSPRHVKVDEIPFDFNRKGLAVVVQHGDERLLITRGMAIPTTTFKAPNLTLSMTERLGSFPIKTRHLPSLLSRRSLLI